MANLSGEALKRWEFENNVTLDDEVYKYNPDKHDAEVNGKPWTRDPKYFKKVKISAIALMKMVMHARSGGDIEVMGIMQGTIAGDTFIITDTFALPVEATETKVNAQAEAYEYIIQYISTVSQAGRVENPVGWYHSHPGYGCWLSGTDVATQMQHQEHNDPWLAVVVDPKRTMSAGKVNIGAFRLYPKGYKPPDEGPQEYQSVPLSKIEDFGVHKDTFYPLEISCFKSSLDTKLLGLLWHRYWVNTLSSSPIHSNRQYVTQQIRDLADKIEQAETQLAHSGGRYSSFLLAGEKKKEESQLSKLTKDCVKTSVEQVNGLATQVVKELLFSQSLASNGAGGAQPMVL